MPTRAVPAKVSCAVGLLVLMTVAQLFVLNANASAGNMKLGGRAISVKDGEPIGGMTIQLFRSAPGQQDQVPKPIAETVTGPNGKFHLSVPRTEQIALVKIRVFPPLPLPCGGVALVDVRGAAQAYVAKGELPTLMPRTFDPSGLPTPTLQRDRVNVNGVAATFESVGQIGSDKDCTGSLGLYDTRDEE